ncbi:MAG: phosphoenolpyruvate--protein phosphotransferase [Deltaproteobacteria bacterium]|nr:phosphoenolpyruvate--protein phosphotransferase [Deltaproteobacteria bacterium]
MDSVGRLQGIAASPGVAIGRAYPVDRQRARVPRVHLDAAVIPAELSRLDAALALSVEQLTAIKETLGESEQAEILEAHAMMLADPGMKDAIVALIRDETLNAEWAVRRVFREFGDKLAGAEELLASRRADFDEVCDRIVHNLMGERPSVLAELPPENSILVAHDLPTADAAVLLSAGRVIGLICDFGSKTSHTAILARALEVPCVVGAGTCSESVQPGQLIAMDGSTGEIWLNPDVVEQKRVEDVRERRKTRDRELLEEKDLPATTKDGRKVGLYANIEFPAEVPSVLAHGGEGIGLYRTEFLYLNREQLPTEEEHYKAYAEILTKMGDKPVVIRTLDLGGDKLPIGHRSHEQNPALGLRAIRLTLKHPALFRTQLRALWRASVHGNLRILLPMIAAVSELREAKQLITQARRELVHEGHTLPERIPLGIMLETPAAALSADRLGRECDFFSIGTNDLIQYAMATDRGNRDVAYLYRPLHLGVLRLIETAVEGAGVNGIEISMCGEMAGDPLYALVLLGLGLDTLSMNPADIPRVKRVLRGSGLRDARELLQAAMSFSSTDEIEKFVMNEMGKRFPELRTAPLLEAGL